MKRHNSMIVVFITIALLTACASSPVRLVEKADGLSRKDPDKAVALYLEAIEEDRFLADAHMGLAKVYEREEQYDDLNKHLEEMFEDLEDFDDKDKLLEEIKEYAQDILDNEPGELGKWADNLWASNEESSVVEAVKETKAETDKVSSIVETVVEEESDTSIQAETKVEETDIRDQYQPFVPTTEATTASSELYENYNGGTIYNYAKNVLDGDKKTAWVEDLKGPGIGEWLYFEGAGSGYIESISIVNGYTKSDKLYAMNDRLATFRLIFSDGSFQDFSLEDNNMDYQTVKLDEPVVTEFVTLMITGLYSGSDYPDCCITEIKFN